MLTKENIEELKPFQARAIVEGLRKGVVPAEYIHFFTVGRENWLKFVGEDLDHYIAEGGSKVRFINEDYGDGKTHFMSVVQYIALQRNFGTSFVVLTKDNPIHKFEVVYRELVQQLQGKFPGKGIRALIDHWLKHQKSDFDSGQEEKIEVFIDSLSEVLQTLPGMSLSFANALSGIFSQYYLKEGVNEDAIHTLYQWFEGNKVSKKDLRVVKLFESLNKTNSRSFLSSLVAFLRYTGHKGLVIFFDELETVLAQSSSIRNATYENVRLFMDNTESSESIYIFFSIIPDVLLSEKGFKSYDALWSRVHAIGNAEELNYRGTQVDLHRTPLTIPELVELGVYLRRIHEISYRWDASKVLDSEVIFKICEAQKEMGVLNEVRLFVKVMIRYLDIAEQGGSLDEFCVSKELVRGQKEIEVEQLNQLEPVWDA